MKNHRERVPHPFGFQRVGFLTLMLTCICDALKSGAFDESTSPIFHFPLSVFALAALLSAVIPVLIMPPRIIFLLLLIIPLRKIHMIAMRLMLPIVVINHLAVIPSMIVAVTSVVGTNLALASRDKHRRR